MHDGTSSETASEDSWVWIAQIEPYEGESISHYFGRFRHHELNSVSAPTPLSDAAGIGFALSRWEKFRFNPFPSRRELAAMAKLVGLDAERLLAMFPPKGIPTVNRSTRLCGACYAEAPYHRMEWQFETTKGCDRHQLRLISRCPACDEKIPLSSEWENGQCSKCGMRFRTMAKKQKRY
ncbi:TniQ family protein [Cyanobacteria bacterium FACHB-471]|nr:TniQ family protein [Cyanobacteria bacterium FACHB-471]